MEVSFYFKYNHAIYLWIKRASVFKSNPVI